MQTGADLELDELAVPRGHGLPETRFEITNASEPAPGFISLSWPQRYQEGFTIRR
jgi:hypothetical protein